MQWCSGVAVLAGQQVRERSRPARTNSHAAARPTTHQKKYSSRVRLSIAVETYDYGK